jgi:hypothetical protein
MGAGELSKGRDIEYNILHMDTGIICNQSAFKHGITRNDIEWAFSAPYLRRSAGRPYKQIGLIPVENSIEVVCITALMTSEGAC